MREAGVPTACSESTPEAPHPQCTSPIQVFLSSVGQEQTPLEDTQARHEEEARTSGVLVNLPAPEDEDDRWTLRDYRGEELCALPCNRWVRPNSGYYLQRERYGSNEIQTVKLPDRFVEPVGSSVTGSYQAERGNPFWSTLSSTELGVPAAILGTVLLVLGLTGDDCDIRDTHCDDTPFAGPSRYHRRQRVSGDGWRNRVLVLLEPPGALRNGSTEREERSQLDPSLAIGPTSVRGSF